MNISPEDLFMILQILHVLACVIVGFTKTPKDDKWPGKVYKYIEKFAFLFGKRAKELPPTDEEEQVNKN